MAALLIVAQACAAAQHRYPVSGLVLSLDQPHQSVLVSHGSIAGYMDAMTMAFHVRGARDLASLHAGDAVAFTLVVDKDSSWAENIRVVEFDSAERDPIQAKRLKLLGSLLEKNAAVALSAGDPVPDFTLTDQTNHPVTFSQFAGKVVAINFVYTRCPLPDYCFRLSNNFGQLRKRFSANPDLILLTVTFDPVNDQPDVLARYAQIWKADPRRWHFLTGPVPEVQHLCALFGVGYWPDEGLYTHALHTAVIDRQGKLAANLEGNRYTAQQLGDLVETVIGWPQ
ncbi:MAG TPA: SCO family protein [Candidatus Acidoferrales bacterium]|nr:SCO family protein [Candidatus Acidoferrales bacterium]